MNRSVHKDTCRIWDRGVCNCGPINAAPESRDAGGAAPSADSDGGAELPQVDANNSGLAMKLADGREVRARLSVDGGSVCFDLTATNAAHTKIALSFEAIESMRLLANRLAAAQECGEAVAPEAKPKADQFDEWWTGKFAVKHPGLATDLHRSVACAAFHGGLSAAPPAPPAPLPGKENEDFEAWRKRRGYLPNTEWMRNESDALTMAMRLYLEDDDTFSPETREVMKRWRPRVDAVLRGEA